MLHRKIINEFRISLLLLLLITCGIVVSCDPPAVGYLSNDIEAQSDTFFVSRGVFVTSSTPKDMHSTPPIKWEIVKVTDSNGKPTNALFEKHKIALWKEPFNPKEDSTLALAKKSVIVKPVPTLKINKVSGELIFTQASKYVKNDIFHISVKATNAKGSKLLENYVVVKLKEYKPVTFPSVMRSRLEVRKPGDSFKPLFTASLRGNNDPKVPSVLNGTNTYFSIQKISDKPSPAIKVHMVVNDSHGNPISPKNIVFYPSGTTYLQNFHDNTTGTITTDTSTIFSLPAPPFPQYGRTYSGANSYLMYYLTTTDALTVDTARYEADFGPVDWSKYKDPETGRILNRGYIRWAFKINDSGTWLIEMNLPYVTIRK